MTLPFLHKNGSNNFGLRSSGTSNAWQTFSYVSKNPDISTGSSAIGEITYFSAEPYLFTRSANPAALSRSLVANHHSHAAYVITNTLFQMPKKYKTTWQHDPRLKHWHVVDYIIARQRETSEMHVMRAMRSTGCWSDHRLLRTVLYVWLTRPRRRQAIRRGKLDITKLRSEWHSGAAAKTSRWRTTSSRQFVSQWQCRGT